MNAFEEVFVDSDIPASLTATSIRPVTELWKVREDSYDIEIGKHCRIDGSFIHFCRPVSNCITSKDVFV